MFNILGLLVRIKYELIGNIKKKKSWKSFIVKENCDLI